MQNGDQVINESINAREEGGHLGFGEPLVGAFWRELAEPLIGIVGKRERYKSLVSFCANKRESARPLDGAARLALAQHGAIAGGAGRRRCSVAHWRFNWRLKCNAGASVAAGGIAGLHRSKQGKRIRQKATPPPPPHVAAERGRAAVSTGGQAVLLGRRLLRPRLRCRRRPPRSQRRAA